MVRAGEDRSAMLSVSCPPVMYFLLDAPRRRPDEVCLDECGYSLATRTYFECRANAGRVDRGWRRRPMFRA